MEYVGARLDGDGRAVRDGANNFIYDRLLETDEDLDTDLPLSGALRMNGYSDWYNRPEPEATQGFSAPGSGLGFISNPFAVSLDLTNLGAARTVNLQVSRVFDGESRSGTLAETEPGSWTFSDGDADSPLAVKLPADLVLDPETPDTIAIMLQASDLEPGLGHIPGVTEDLMREIQVKEDGNASAQFSNATVMVTLELPNGLDAGVLDQGIIRLAVNQQAPQQFDIAETDLDSRVLQTVDSAVVVSVDFYGLALRSDARDGLSLVIEAPNLGISGGVGLQEVLETATDSLVFTTESLGEVGTQIIPTTEDEDGIEGQLPEATEETDPDVNLDRLVFKVRVVAPEEVIDALGNAIRLRAKVDGTAKEDVEIELVPDPSGGAFLTAKPILLYSDPNGEVDTAAIRTLLPADTVLLDPDEVEVLPGWQATVPGALATKGTRQLKLFIPTTGVGMSEHDPAQNPAQVAAAIAPGNEITKPSAATKRFLYQLDEDDNLPAIAFECRRHDGLRIALKANYEWQWYLRLKFKAGNHQFPSAKKFQIDQWHLLSGDRIVEFQGNQAAVADGLGGIGAGDYELFCRLLIKDGATAKAVHESNHITFKILGKNPGQQRITALVDTFANPQVGQKTIALKGWYKAILAKESKAAGYNARSDWDHFEASPESGGVDVGFRRGVTYAGRRYRWDARFGFPFVSVDNGWGIAQLTNPLPEYRHVHRWTNNVKKGWIHLTAVCLPDAVGWLTRKSGLAASAIPESVIALETVRRFNGGREHIYQNGQFVRSPQGTRNTTYVQDVESEKASGGF
jgi:hypothetical protein